MVRRCTVLALLSLAPLLVAASCRGDDWLQFRHDPSRSAISQDKLVFPLKPLWTWATAGPGGHRPLHHAVVRQKRVYFTASDKKTRYLICAEAKTGEVKWRCPLQVERLDFAISDITGPALTDTGKVFVYDWITVRDKNTIASLTALLFEQSKSALCGIVPEEVDCFAVRTFDAETGKEGPYFPLAAMGANGVLPRVSLTETKQGQEVAAVPPTMAGCPP